MTTDHHNATSGAFAKAFMPGLILGLVIGLFGGVLAAVFIQAPGALDGSTTQTSHNGSQDTTRDGVDPAPREEAQDPADDAMDEAEEGIDDATPESEGD